MAAKFLPEAHAEIVVDNHPNPARLVDAFALSQFAEAARYPVDYSADERWMEAVTLSAHGRELAASNAVRGAGVSEADIRLAALGHLYWCDLLVDLEGSNLDLAHQILEAELMSGRIRLPFRFGRLLYDAFNKQHPEGYVNELSAIDAWKLLDGMPQGVFQIGQLVTGPLGVLRSQEHRLYPPQVPHALWHSRRHGQTEGHSVPFTPPNIGIVRAYNAIAEAAEDGVGSCSHFLGALARLACRERDVPSRNHGIGVLIADCILDAERLALTELALAGSGGEYIRSAVGSPPRRASAGKGSASDLAKRLSEIEQLQVLMLLPDASLASLIDLACAKRVLKIPAFEVRHPRIMPADPSGRVVRSELSSEGIRQVDGNCTLRLTELVFDGHARAGDLSGLSWKLRPHASGVPLVDLSAFVAREGPIAVVRRLLLTSRPATETALRELGIAGSSASDDELERIILWKCGFNIPRYARSLSDLRSRLQGLQETTMAATEVVTEEQRAAIRGVAVNLFTSIEHLLESVVAYLFWLLASDHVEVTRLTFQYTDALRTVADVLTELPSATGEDGRPVRWDVSGANTLGTLLQYFSALGDWTEGKVDADREWVRRPIADCPTGATLAGRRYAFEHVEFWADCAPPGLQRLAATLREVSRLLGRADVAGVRNAILHKRDDDEFPSVDRILSFVLFMGQAVERIDSARLFPKEYWVVDKTTDRYQQSAYRLQDYRGSILELRTPCPLYGLRRSDKLGFDAPALVAPDGLLASPNSEIVLSIAADSPFERYWKDYPTVRDVDLGDGGTLEQPSLDASSSAA